MSAASASALHEALDTTTPGGRLIFHVFAALAEFIRALIVADTGRDTGGLSYSTVAGSPRNPACW